MRTLIQIFTHNPGLKVAALFLALITWYYLVTAGLEERRFSRVLVQEVNLPPDVAVLSRDVQRVALTLKGPRGQLDALEGSPLIARVDLSGMRVPPGQPLKRSIRLDGSDIRIAVDAQNSMPLPYNVRFAGAEPEVVTLTLNTMIEKLLTVEPALEGKVAPGFLLKATAIPQSVRVRGPVRLLENRTVLGTKPISVEGLSKSDRRPVQLETQMTSTEFPEFGAVTITPSEAEVKVILEVTPKPEEKIIERVAVRLAAVPENVAVIQKDPTEVTVKLRGPQRLLRELDAQNLVAELNLEREQPPARESAVVSYFLLRDNLRQLAERGVSLPLPADIELVDVQPKNVVQLTIDRLRSVSLPVKATLVGEPAEDHEVTEKLVVPENVMVQGPQSIVGKMKAIDTLPVLVTGVKERLRRTVRLVESVDVGAFRAVHIVPSQQLVDVVLAVAERRERKTLTDLPVQLLVPPKTAFNIPIDVKPKSIGPVSFVGPRSRMERFTADSVLAFVRFEVTKPDDLRATILNIEFHIRDPQVQLAPDSKPITVELDFLKGGRPPEKKTNP